MALYDYCPEMNDLMLHVVKLNAGIINHKQLIEEIEKLKLYNGKHKVTNQIWLRALDYMDDHQAKIAILQDLCDYQHDIKVIIESKSTSRPDKMLTLVLEVKTTDTVASVKTKIQCYNRQSPPSEYRLFLKEELLEDGRTMAHYQIKNGTVLRLEVPTFVLFCLVTEGPRLSIEVRPTDTIENVKLKIYRSQRDGIPRDQQRLVYDGRQLEDRLTLADYNIITPGITVHVLLRLRGS